MIGQTISHYRITAELGAGGMGVVYAAEDLKLGRTVALKFLPAELTRDAIAKERFVNEARTASGFAHPNICTIHEIDESDDGRLFLSMPRYEGETLRERLREGPLTTDEAVRVVRQLARGLARAHAQGIVHRDIKPANVFLTDAGQAVLLDFGLAKLAGESFLTLTGTTLGTPAYLAPEQAQGGDTSAAADVWSLGVVLHEMLAGRRPFGGEYPQAAIYAILHEEPAPLPAAVPAALVRITARCLAKDPSRRYPNAGALLEDLEGLVTGRAPGLTRASPRSPVWRKRHGLVLATLLLAATAVVTVWRVAPGRGPDAAVSHPSGARSLAVLPFSYRGDPAYAYLDEGLMDLMITNLDGIGATRTASATEVAAAVARTGGEFRRDQAAAVARSLGAARFVTGEIVEAGGHLRVQAGLHAGDGTEILRATATGAVGDLFALVDELGAQLLVDEETSPLEHLEVAARHSTASLPALKAYLEGERLYRGFCADTDGEYRDSAGAAFAQAVALDDSFALAWYRLACIGDFDNPYHDQDVTDALARAVALSERLPTRERRLVAAAYAVRRGGFDRAESLYQEILTDHPQDLEALIRLAKLLFETSWFRGRPWQEALPFSEQVLALSPWWQEAAARGALEIGWECRFHLSQRAVVDGDWDRFDELGMAFSPWFRAQRAFGSGDDRAQEAILAELAAEPHDFSLVAASAFVASPVWHAEAFRRVIALMLAPGRARQTQIYGRLLLAGAATRAGRWREACSHLDSAAVVDANVTLTHRAHLATLPFVPASPAELEALDRQLATLIVVETDSAQPLWRDWQGYENLTAAYLRGLVALRLGRQDEALVWAATLDTLRTLRDTGSAARDLAAGLRARVARRQGDSAAALALLEGAERRVPLGLHWHNLITGQPAERLLRADLLLAAGRPVEAQRWYASLDNGFNVHLGAVADLGQARALAQLGRTDEAATLFDRFLAAMADCDPGFAPLVAKAQEERDALRVGA